MWNISSGCGRAAPMSEAGSSRLPQSSWVLRLQGKSRPKPQAGGTCEQFQARCNRARPTSHPPTHTHASLLTLSLPSGFLFSFFTLCMTGEDALHSETPRKSTENLFRNTVKTYFFKCPPSFSCSNFIRFRYPLHNPSTSQFWFTASQHRWRRRPYSWRVSCQHGRRGPR